jgi:hypothetical protein
MSELKADCVGQIINPRIDAGYVDACQIAPQALYRQHVPLHL